MKCQGNVPKKLHDFFVLNISQEHEVNSHPASLAFQPLTKSHILNTVPQHST